MQTIDTTVENFHLSRILSIWNRICQTLTALDDLKSGKNQIREHADEDPETDMIDLIEYELVHRHPCFCPDCRQQYRYVTG